MTYRFAFDPRTDDPRPLAEIARASAIRQALVAPDPELTDDYLARCAVCPDCSLYHSASDECPAPPGHCVDEITSPRNP